LKKFFESTEPNNIPELQPMLVVEQSSLQPYFTQDDQEDEYALKQKYASPLKYKKDFLQEMGRKTDRPIRIYSQLICKPGFIIHHINECTIVSSEMLVADQKTLFSQQFPVYKYYRAPFRKWCVPQPKKNHALIHHRCSSFALCQVKNDGNRSLFERILNQFSSATQNELKQFWDLANNLVIYWKDLLDEDEVSCLFKKAKDLLINVKLDACVDLRAITKLTEGNIISFVNECLSGYLRAYNDIMLINKDPMTGDYKENTNIDYDFAKRYGMKRQIFDKIRSQLAELWTDLEYPFKEEESYSMYSDLGGQSVFRAC